MNHNPIWSRTIITGTFAACGLITPAAHADNQYEIEISGIVEIQASGGRAINGAANSDITLATVEIALDSVITDHVSTHLLLLHEENGRRLEIDEGTITLSHLGDLPIAMTAGQMYLPFGSFESHLVSDPLTLEIGETRESVIQFGTTIGNAYGAIYSFKGETSQQGKSGRVKGFGASIRLTIENKGFTLDTGISYLSNMAETNTLEDAVADTENLIDAPGGIGLHAIVRSGPLTVISEYIGAHHHFDAANLTFNGNPAKPAAYNIEAGYELLLFGKEATVALAIQGSSEAQSLGLPESRLLGGVSVNIREQTSLSFEWARSDDYDSADGDTGLSTKLYTALIAVEF